MTDILFHTNNGRQIMIIITKDLDFSYRKIINLEEEREDFLKWDRISIDKVNKVKADYILKNKLKDFIENM